MSDNYPTTSTLHVILNTKNYNLFSMQHLVFLKQFAKEGDHYNFSDEVKKIKPQTYATLSDLKNFSDNEIEQLSTRIKFHRDYSSSDLSNILMAKSKIALPNLVANNIAEHPENGFEPYHHVLMKMGALHSETLRNVSVAIPKLRWQRETYHTIPVEAMYHPNLTKEHALDILNSARDNKNPYLDQMERQFKKRYNEANV